MVLHLSHALLGMLTALNVIYPIKSISQPPPLVLTAAVLGGCCLLGAALLAVALWARRGGRPAADQSPIGGASATGRHYDSLLARPPAAGLVLAAAHLGAAALAAAAVLGAALAAPADTALALLRWAALLLVLTRLLVTVATMFCEDALSSAVLAWLRAVCCCCHGNNIVHPVATTGDDPAHTELDDNFEI
ncbi:hypothetical protein FJT64_004396 [Amphibalanus amphitrite]|uniref:Uncharacterized protein n=1 Tax=Amphibalanus amphitrite TaxID=1232801 RepID=A0A6A4VX67_AMPAM|nr:hypothetical protein FJT64_004396 [Amphibalanus amphitrite]